MFDIFINFCVEGSDTVYGVRSRRLGSQVITQTDFALYVVVVSGIVVFYVACRDILLAGVGDDVVEMFYCRFNVVMVGHVGRVKVVFCEGGEGRPVGIFVISVGLFGSALVRCAEMV